MRLPHTLALLRRPRRAAAHTATIAPHPVPAAAQRVRPVRVDTIVPAAALAEAPFIDLAQRVREVGEW